MVIVPLREVGVVDLEVAVGVQGHVLIGVILGRVVVIKSAKAEKGQDLGVVDPAVRDQPQIAVVVGVVVHVTVVGARVINATEIGVIDMKKIAQGRGRVMIVVAALGIDALVLEVRITVPLVDVNQYKRRISMIAKPPQVILEMPKCQRNAALVVLASRMVKKPRS